MRVHKCPTRGWRQGVDLLTVRGEEFFIYSRESLAVFVGGIECAVILAATNAAGEDRVECRLPVGTGEL